MSSGDEGEESVDAIKAVQAAMIHTAFCHMTRIDVRALPLMEGLFEYQDQSGDGITDGLLDVILDSGHVNRVQAPRGPYVFAKAEAGRYVRHSVPDMVVAENAKARRTSVAYLATGLEGEPWLSPNTGHFLRERRADIESEDISEWVVPACELRSLCEDDCVMRLAGIGQLLHVGLQDITVGEWSRILEPSCASLLSTENDHYDVLIQSERALEERALIVHEAHSLGELIASYRSQLGHVPFAAPFDLGDVLWEYVQMRNVSQEQVWSEFKRILGTTQDQVMKYHLLEAAVVRPGLLPQQARVEALQAAVAFIAPLADGGGAQDTAEWDLRAVLARYYTLYIELHGPPLDPQRTMVCSWWATDQVVENVLARAASRPPDRKIQRWISKTIAPIVYKVELLHLVGGPAIAPSVGRLFTLHLRAPWSLSLLGQVLRNLNDLPVKNLTADQEDTITKATAVYLSLGYFPEKDNGTRKPFQFQACSLGAAKGWYDCIRNQVAREAFGQCLRTAEHLYHAAGLAESLSKYEDLTTADRAAVMSVLRSIAVSGEVSLNSIWRRPEVWMGAAIRDSSTTNLQCLSESLIALLRRESQELRFALPHLWARCAEERVDANDQERFVFCLWNLIASCIATVSFSALRRLMGNPKARQMRDRLVELRNNLDIISEGAPAEVKGWLREIAVCLDN